jgi:hypothetical protein
MKEVICFSVLLFITSSALAQPCDCAVDYQFLKNYMEANHPGLNSNYRKSEKEYNTKAGQILLTIKKVNPSSDCILYLQQYVALLKDHHTHINTIVPPFTTLSTAPQQDSFFQTATYKNNKKRQIDSIAIVAQLQNKKPDEIEGLYKDPNGHLIAFIRENTKSWPIKGIALSSVRTHTKGTIRYELQPVSNTAIWAMVLLPDYQKVYTTTSLENGTLKDLGLTKVNSQSSNAPRENKGFYEFRELNDSTHYLRVSSFWADLNMELDSFYKSIDEHITRKPYLIIDVRNNPGGAEGNYFSLIKYIYTQPIHPDVFEYYATPDNIQRYREAVSRMEADSARYGRGIIQSYRGVVERMVQAKPYTFIQPAKGAVISQDSILSYPKNVVILINRGCASSCEAFVYNASQSSKVVTLGGNTGGFMGYGNTMPLKTPCYNYSFETTTTRYKKLYKYEFTGISPTVELQKGEDWIQKALAFLERR